MVDQWVTTILLGVTVDKRNVLTDIVDNIYEGVAVVAETTGVLAGIIDKAGIAVQEGIDHLQDVFPDWFTKEEDIDLTGEEPMGWTDEFSDWLGKVNEAEPVVSREDKIKDIQDWLGSNGYPRSAWHTSPDVIEDRIVNAVWDAHIEANKV